jgi:parvulin-like peptidyl-prolyl isomerase
VIVEPKDLKKPRYPKVVFLFFYFSIFLLIYSSNTYSQQQNNLHALDKSDRAKIDFRELSAEGQAAKADKIVAVVNDQIITQKDLDDFVNFMRIQLSAEYKGRELEEKMQQMKLELLTRLIEDRLILQQAKKEDIDIPREQIEKRLRAIKRKYSGEEEFQQALLKQGLVPTDLRTRIKEQMLIYAVIEAKIKNKISISPFEVTRFYEQHRGDFVIPQKRKVISLSTKTEEVAREVSGFLKKHPEAFGQVAARMFSLKMNDFGYIQKEALKKEIRQIVFGLKAGAISEPIEIEQTFYIFKVEEILPGREAGLLEVRDKIYNFLFQAKMERRLAQWLDELKQESYIEIK